MSFLINPFVSSTPPTYTYNTRSLDTSDATTYTYTNLNIGTAAVDRFVIVTITSRGGSVTTITSVTIGGNAATQLAFVNSGVSGGYAAIYGLLVPTGTTATVVVTQSALTLDCLVSSYSLYGLSSTTPYATATAGNSLPTLTVNANTVKDAIIIGVSQFGSNTAATQAWSGLTQRWEEIGEATRIRWAGADAIETVAQSPRAMSISYSANPTTQLYAAVAVMR